MANRLSITNNAEFESAISTQKEIGREQYHNYLKSQKMKNQISKEELVKYLKQQVEQFRISSESYTNKGPNYRATEATYSTYFSILNRVELGMYDKQNKMENQIQQLIENYENQLNSSTKSLEHLYNLNDWSEEFDNEKDYDSEVCYRESEVDMIEGFLINLKKIK